MIWLEKFREVARECGYALAEHGSKIKDFDLIAVPWTDDAIDPDELVRRLCAIYPDHKFMHPEEKEENLRKPHGRRAYTIFIARGTYLDLSITPRLR